LGLRLWVPRGRVAEYRVVDKCQEWCLWFVYQLGLSDACIVQLCVFPTRHISARKGFRFSVIDSLLACRPRSFIARVQDKGVAGLLPIVQKLVDLYHLQSGVEQRQHASCLARSLTRN
jgi:hypothetical protein